MIFMVYKFYYISFFYLNLIDIMKERLRNIIKSNSSTDTLNIISFGGICRWPTGTVVGRSHIDWLDDCGY